MVTEKTIIYQGKTYPIKKKHIVFTVEYEDTIPYMPTKSRFINSITTAILNYNSNRSDMTTRYDLISFNDVDIDDEKTENEVKSDSSVSSIKRSK